MPRDGTRNSSTGAAPLLGGLSRREFLQRHWQQRPLLVRGAFARSIARISNRERLVALAGRDDVESRLVERRGARWRVSHGPIAAARFPNASASRWTVLVNGANFHLPAAQALLEHFSFLSWARIDDVMASYASPGGGVGPHWDSYDVFLVQGSGRRSWRLAAPRDYAMLESAPLKLIAGFRAEEEHVLGPGDMLYVPPGWGHEGTALEACITYSVGFRAPGAAQLGAAFLDWLQERGIPEARYRDKQEAPSPGRIPASLAGFARAATGRLAWSPRDVAHFLGEYLSAPKPQIAFRRPGRALARAAFERRLAGAAVELDAKSLMLYDQESLYLNGERLVFPRRSRGALRQLSDTRRIAGAALVRAGAGTLMHEWYLLGYIHLRP